MSLMAEQAGDRRQIRSRRWEIASPGGPSYTPSRLIRMMLALCQRLPVGQIEVILPDGTRHGFEGQEAGPKGVLQVHNDRVARRLFLGGMLGFCESYLDGDWSSPDIAALFNWALANEAHFAKLLDGPRWFQIAQNLLHRLKPNTKRGSRRNIAFHYDLGNAFYEKWLDRSMTYSSAVFDSLTAPEPMESAQQRKYAEIARRLDLRPGHHVLEIGCGWGGFAEYAAEIVGARVTAVTISAEQKSFAEARMAAKGLADRVEIRLSDYRDMQGTFDRIASIEMFEAVGERYWPDFFAIVRNRLAPGGYAALQVITIADRLFEGYRRSADYIQRYVFPGGMLPSPKRLRQEIATAGLAWRESQAFGPHYARTLAEWQRRFQDAWADIANMGFDSRFKRLWEQYLAYCQAGFAAGTIDVLQLTLARDPT